MNRNATRCGWTSATHPLQRDPGPVPRIHRQHLADGDATRRFQLFTNLTKKYPEIKPNLEKCYMEIQARYVGMQSNQNKRERKRFWTF